MLPSSKIYLINGGFTPQAAAWTLLGCFMAGFVSIQFISRFLHHYIPSHVEHCDHDNEHKDVEYGHDHGHDGHNSRRNSHGHYGRSRPVSNGSQLDGASKSKFSDTTEASPLLSGTGAPIRPSLQTNGSNRKSHKGRRSRSRSRNNPDGRERRPSMMEVPAKVMSFVKDTKTDCHEGGKCFGYTGPCGQECYKVTCPITPTNSRHQSLLRTGTGTFHGHAVPPVLDEEDEAASSALAACSPLTTRSHSCEPMDEGEDIEADHHHHVAENRFMNIGLQTSIAIALHKLPEGFITYATNHANPSLGLSVFMALFVHNFTEGFALALPLFLASRSRFWAMFWAALLGGLSQPVGAGIAWVWFRITGTEGHTPSSGVYGCMFAVTAGIMASVALQLFTEGLGANHNRTNLCTAFAFIGMAIMGTSGALTA